MKILLANADRSFLNAFKRLLEMNGYEVATAFDGIQAISGTRTESPDIVILDSELPLVDTDRLAAEAESSGIYCLTLLESQLSSELLTTRLHASEYLTLPFTAEEITGVLSDLGKLRKGKEKFKLEGIEADGSGLTFGGQRITLSEYRILKQLSEGQNPGADAGTVYVSALNSKLGKLGSDARIQYIIQKGYSVVK